VNRRTEQIPTFVLALAGMTFVIASGMRWGVPLLAWIAPVPWMLWIRRTTRRRERLLILALLGLATVAQVAKIITPPIPAVLALGFGLPAALGSWLMLIAWDALRRRSSEVHALYAWPAMAALNEWSSYSLGPMGVWGTGASTQPDNLALLQLAGLFGVASIGALMAWVAAFLAGALAAPEQKWGRHGALLGLVLVVVFAHGAWRLNLPSRGQTVRVAAVVTDLGFAPDTLPTREELDSNLETLFQRSTWAAERGARVIAWNEGASIVERRDEPALLARASAFAVEQGVDLVVAYIVPTSYEPFRFENLAVYFDDRGAERARYRKRHPVPGEGAEASDNPVPRIERPFGVVSLAICYDHDYPEMSRGHAGVGAGLVLLPSSDWAGIDPLHTQFARVRAIEGGFSILRPTRWAASAGFDPMGRVRGWMRVDEDNQRVLITEVPVEPRRTLYAAVGDVPVVAGASSYILILLGWIVRRRRP